MTKNHSVFALSLLLSMTTVGCASDSQSTSTAEGDRASGSGEALGMGAAFSGSGGSGGGDSLGANGGTPSDTGGSNDGANGGGELSGTGGTFDTPLVAQCPVEGVFDAQILEALSRGEGSTIPSVEHAIEAVRAAISVANSRMDETLVELFALADDGSATSSSLTSIDWNPSHDAVTFSTSYGKNAVAISSNAVFEGGAEIRNEALAVVGQSDGTRYMALGANPFRTNSERNNSSVVNDEMNRFLENAIGWLAQRDSSEQKHVVLAHLDESTWFADEGSTRTWLGEHFDQAITWNEWGACDGDALLGCLDSGPDLLIVSQHYDDATTDPLAVAAFIEEGMAHGIPVLYLQRDGSMNALGNELLTLLHIERIRDNQWTKLSAQGFDGRSTLGATPTNYQSIDTALEHLSTGAFGFSLADVASDPWNHAGFMEEFGAGARAVRAILKRHDESGRSIFESCDDSVVDKLLVLLGDRLREDISYPMAVGTTERGAFLRAYFADHAVLSRRPTGPPQPDRGNFDPKDLTGVVGVEKKVQLVSRPRFRSTGAYLLPGKTARITRLDAGAGTTKVFVNSIRDSATHEWSDSESAYPRPKFLQSAHILLEAGETIELNHPYGGPIQIEFNALGETVELVFEGVGEHPHWRGAEDDESFVERLQQGTYNWVEVATDGFELHSRLDKFQQTMDDERWNTPAKLAATIEKYTFDEVHIMAGFSGDGISHRPEVHGWAQEHSLEVPVLDRVKHANMDQATCGSGCSGNPYDAYWAFAPIGHGDLHELGHSLQNPRFQLMHAGATYGNHAVTNWSPFHSASRYYEDHGGEVPGWRIPHAHLYAELQAAYSAGERPGDFSDHMNAFLGAAITSDGEIRNCYAFFMQAGMSARHAGMLENGYYIVPRVHILDRAFQKALSNEGAWLAAREGLGFGLMSLASAEQMTNNDFMLVALSFVTGLDYRDYFAMWGVGTSDASRQQVASFGYDEVPRAFFAMSDIDHSRAALSTQFSRIVRLPIDGTTTWPNP